MLVGLVAKGQALPDIAKAIGERRGQVDALQRKLAEPVDIHLDRESLRAGLTMIRTFRNGDRIIDDPKNDFIIYEPSRLTGPLANGHDPVGVRSALRKVGVQRIIIKPVADGWTFEGVADLGRLVNNRGKTAPPSPPRSETPRRSRDAPRNRFAVWGASMGPPSPRVRGLRLSHAAFRAGAACPPGTRRRRRRSVGP